MRGTEGQRLLEVSTRTNAACILALSEHVSGVASAGEYAMQVLVSLIEASVAAGENEELSRRCVCLATAASRVVVVLHLAVSSSGESTRLESISNKHSDVKKWVVGYLRGSCLQ